MVNIGSGNGLLARLLGAKTAFPEPQLIYIVI